MRPFVLSSMPHLDASNADALERRSRINLTFSPTSETNSHSTASAASACSAERRWNLMLPPIWNKLDPRNIRILDLNNQLTKRAVMNTRLAFNENDPLLRARVQFVGPSTY